MEDKLDTIIELLSSINKNLKDITKTVNSIDAVSSSIDSNTSDNYQFQIHDKLDDIHELMKDNL